MQHYGYGKTTVDDIAHEAGIGKGTVYLHFDSKADVALSCIDRMNAQLQARLGEIVAEPESPALQVKEVLTARVMFRFDHAHAYSQSIDEIYSALRPQLMERRERNHEIEAGILAGPIEAGMRSGQFAACDPLAAARTLIVASNSLLAYSRNPRTLGERHVLESAIGAVADMLLFGLMARET
jgi:AcrR family transcriptional regulator